ncbi:MAG TPA: type I restriction enzyme HsdR N-terminal domain-containing protein [Candidatus Dwaynia gallinarum]|nr:type I restriction enzyme HsdR N-terminal domain-containing protein [Candidatus Dwaynia gallinarum]
MDFIDKLRQHAKKIEIMRDNLLTEEATKTALVMPFFSLLDYDVFNPMEFVPEYVADVGTKKGEKVDYAIMNDGKPVILIECKSVKDTLTNHDAQLFRYFIATESKFAILTNGIIYKFFTDLEESNKMDEQPFLEINLLDLNELHISELKKFTKDNFDIDTIFNAASELKYTNLITKQLTDQLNNPSSEFVKFIISDFFTGSKTTSVIDKFKPIVKKSMYQFVNDFMNDKIKSILNNSKNDENEDVNIDELENEDIFVDNKVVTTEEELEGFNIVRSILSELVSVEDIGYKDVERYFGILYQSNIRKWVCRLYFNSSKKSIAISDEDKREVRYYIDNISDIYKYKNELLKSLDKYLDKTHV